MTIIIHNKRELDITQDAHDKFVQCQLRTLRPKTPNSYDTLRMTITSQRKILAYTRVFQCFNSTSSRRMEITTRFTISIEARKEEEK